MLRRVFSIALLPCLLLLQAVALGHVHETATQRGHDSRQHVHIALLGDHHVHSETGNHDHGHHVHSDALTPVVDDDPSSSSPIQDHDSKHDNDALYISPSGTIPIRLADHYAANASIWITPLVNTSVVDYVFLANWSSENSPPMSSWPRQQIYLRHLSLLI